MVQFLRTLTIFIYFLIKSVMQYLVFGDMTICVVPFPSFCTLKKFLICDDSINNSEKSKDGFILTFFSREKLKTYFIVVYRDVYRYFDTK